MSIVDQITEPYAAGPETDALFVEAMKEVTRWHMERSPFYSRWAASQGFSPESLRTVADCARIPFVLADLFKKRSDHRDLLSVPASEASIVMTSSGTTGQKSQIRFDGRSLAAAQRMLDRIAAHQGWIAPEEPTDYLLYSYEPESKPGLGTAYTDNYLCGYAPARHVTHALRHLGEGRHGFDQPSCEAALQRAAADGVPLRIFGFPAFLHATLAERWARAEKPLRLSPRSLVFLGGGWKGHADREIPKKELYALITAQLGIPDGRIRDGFGSVEHCVPYVECSHHEFHAPTWSRVLVRDTATLEPVGEGTAGFLSFLSPYITSQPAHSIVMGDLATWHRGASCPCGTPTDYFRVLGRAGTQRSRSCAIAAAELLK